MSSFILDQVDKVLKETRLKLDRPNVKLRTPAREGLIDYNHFPIIRSDGTKVGTFILDTFETSVSTETLPCATEAEATVIKRAEKLAKDLITEIE